MQKTFEAVYEDGVLKPLEALLLADRQHVQVTIVEVPPDGSGADSYFEESEWDASKYDRVSLEEVRCAMSSIRTSLSDTVIAARDDRP